MAFAEDSTASKASSESAVLNVQETHDRGGASEEAQVGQSESDQIEAKYPKSLSFFILFFGLALTVFCIGLDNTIVGIVSIFSFKPAFILANPS